MAQGNGARMLAVPYEGDTRWQPLAFPWCQYYFASANANSSATGMWLRLKIKQAHHATTQTWKKGSELGQYLTTYVPHYGTTGSHHGCAALIPRHLSTNKGRVVEDIFATLSEKHGTRVCPS